MAYSSLVSAPTTWCVMHGGDDTNNAGCFDGVTGTPGTDYSKQAAAQRTWKAAGGTFTNNLNFTNASPSVCTSASYNFAAADVGNYINVTAGTNLNAGRYRIVSVAANAATMDQNVTTGAAPAADGTGYEGGAMASPEAVDALVKPGNICWVDGSVTGQSEATKTTTRTLTASGTLTGGEIAFIGVPAGGPYLDVDVADASQPVYTSGTNSNNIFTLNGASRRRFRNIKTTHTAGTRGRGWTSVTTTCNGVVWENCSADGCLNGWWPNTATLADCVWSRCNAKNCTSDGFSSQTSAMSRPRFEYCVGNTNAGAGFNITSNGTAGATFVRCVAYGNTGSGGHGFFDPATTSDSAGTFVFDGCNAYGNAQAGFRAAYTTGGVRGLVFNNCVAYGNTVAEFSCPTAGLLDGTTGLSAYPRVRNCAVKSGGGSSGERVNFRQGEGYIQLTADPFTNGSGGDFSLNAYGKSVLQGLGYPTEIGVKGSATATYPNVGAADPSHVAAAFASV